MRPAALGAAGDPAFRRKILTWLAALWLFRVGVRAGVRAARRPRRDRGSEPEVSGSDRPE